MKRAYSLLEIKSINDDQRIITGIASTPTADRMGDIVEPDGAQFNLPIPLLWQHESHEPVGSVIDAKVTKKGIQITAQFAKVDEPPSLKESLDSAWAQVKAKLVRGLSIGFMPIESSDIEGSWSQRFIKWDWLELSCVTIPANMDASITSVKSVDRKLRAASGESQRVVVRLTPTPGVSGQKALRRPGVVYLD